jgi:hypothetical protein
MATIYARSNLVPVHFQNKPENVFIALQIAARCGLDPFGVLQNVYVISGKPAFETKLALAMLNVSGKTVGPVSYVHDGRGKERSCTASVKDASTGRILSHRLHWATVEQEGWPKRAGSKWATDPLIMLEYRSVMRLIRTHYPEVLLGVNSVEEVSELPTTSGVEVWDLHAHGDKRVEDATAKADEQAEQSGAPAKSIAEEAPVEPFCGIGDEHFVARLEGCENLGQVTATEVWAIFQSDDSDEKEWVRDMCKRRAEAIREGRSETQEAK